ncbi:MAG: magnesium-translocating P-type ATPase [Candidatus Aminicenantes bacterium]|nr:magnesium-translocating P-type ATPase [Candidatus Aminicenantes bacterium]MDH5744065.1 magnesium-translocating P-type ATPase [Candidatus Aminicenantes bacterium]
MAKKAGLPFWAQSDEEVYRYFESSPDGLLEAEAKKRLREYGPNEIARKDKRHGLEIFLSQFKNALVFVLIVAAVIAFFLHDRIDALVIFVIVMMNSILGFFQEYRAERALRELKKYITQTTKVVRDGNIEEIDAKEIVPGDIIPLGLGDVVVADLRILHAESLSTDESALTGESMPVAKNNSTIAEEPDLPQYLSNIGFMGTSVVSGSGRGLVIATGKDTFFGKTSAFIEQTPHEGDFQRNVKKFSNFLLIVILSMTVFIFASNALLHKGIFESFLFALALAVGITPEVLPIIMTITLSNGALRMAKEKVVVKRLVAVEDFGNIDTLCCDKTGTLTEGEVSLSDNANLDGQKDEKLVLYGLLCNSAFIAKEKKIFGNPIDKAIWQAAQSARLEHEVKQYVLIDRNEFDFERKRMSVLVKRNNIKTLIAKGAPESIVKICGSATLQGKAKALTPDLTSAILKKIAEYETNGYRVIALTDRFLDREKIELEDESGLNLLGFLLFLDPPKPTVKKSLKILQGLGVKIKVISGDSPTITRKICQDVGLRIAEDRVIVGDELEHLDEAEFKEYARKYDVFTRVSPEHKFRIVESLKREQHIVGFLGDGINDAPALKVADVGISVDSATGIAKETADIILLRKSLRVLAHGIIEGRKTFSNITKYIFNTISANYGNMFTIAFSSLFLKFIPLLPSQILLNNFVSDVPLLMISTDNVDEEFLKRPRRWSIKLIFGFMTYFGLISTFFDLVLILGLILVIKSGTELFRTAWFVESVLSELMITFAIRTRQPFFKSRPSRWLLIASVVAGIVSVAITFLVIGHTLFEFVRIPVSILIFIGGILLVYFFTVELAKKHFFKKHEL